MEKIIFALDVAFSPVDEFFFMMAEGGWLIAVTALLVIGAVVGILVFNKKKKGEKK